MGAGKCRELRGGAATPQRRSWSAGRAQSRGSWLHGVGDRGAGAARFCRGRNAHRLTRRDGGRRPVGFAGRANKHWGSSEDGRTPRRDRPLKGGNRESGKVKLMAGRSGAWPCSRLRGGLPAKHAKSTKWEPGRMPALRWWVSRPAIEAAGSNLRAKRGLPKLSALAAIISLRRLRAR
jgi:hypothetical protein